MVGVITIYTKFYDKLGVGAGGALVNYFSKKKFRLAQTGLKNYEKKV